MEANNEAKQRCVCNLHMERLFFKNRLAIFTESWLPTWFTEEGLGRLLRRLALGTPFWPRKIFELEQGCGYVLERSYGTCSECGGFEADRVDVLRIPYRSGWFGVTVLDLESFPLPPPQNAPERYGQVPPESVDDLTVFGLLEKLLQKCRDEPAALAEAIEMLSGIEDEEE